MRKSKPQEPQADFKLQSTLHPKAAARLPCYLAEPSTLLSEAGGARNLAQDAHEPTHKIFQNLEFPIKSCLENWHIVCEELGYVSISARRLRRPSQYTANM